MRYILLIHNDEKAPPLMTPDKQMEAYGVFTQEIQSAGVMVGGERLHPSTAAKSVRVRNGATAATDGPFAETKEQLGGFYIVDCKSEADAVAYAAKIPGALDGTIEVRPIWEM